MNLFSFNSFYSASLRYLVHSSRKKPNQGVSLAGVVCFVLVRACLFVKPCLAVDMQGQ